MTRLATRFPMTLGELACRAWVDRIASARGVWISNFGGIQFTLGRAWYTHLEDDREDEYFEEAAASDAVVEQVLPGFRQEMFAMAQSVVGEPVVQRQDWCGPGMHIFPAGSHVARSGGDLHFDTEGLTSQHVAARAPALTLVLMLQPPTAGGGLGVWDRVYAGDDFPERPGPDTRMETVTYQTGELVVIDSYRLHQILPFTGEADRISATLHLARESTGWVGWF